MLLILLTDEHASKIVARDLRRRGETVISAHPIPKLPSGISIIASVWNIFFVRLGMHQVLNLKCIEFVCREYFSCEALSEEALSLQGEMFMVP
jgi:hypothetical protein